ncbi:hypothetical protein [Parvularcula maris]|uniref:Phosphopantetheine adenylyltransferase n=1 Tax=Parvularcula maris TaxID=2965077 RepID=A0A9X2L6C6_9PROT|nr:hypothetical protein [Parvularcula maris]MCQ8183893.1 hypothetical protein [Parvularcula maris]
MEILTRIAWAALALLHLAPAAVLFIPSMVSRLYGADPSGDVGVLLVHRGALFLAVVLVSLLAVFDPSARRAASLVAAVSMLGFIVVYARAGMPEGALAKIAVADAMGLVPLALVLWTAWRG